MTTTKPVFKNVKKRFGRRIETKNAFKKALRQLEKRFPKVFNLKHPKPLALGIREDIFMSETGMSKKSIRKALTFYCGSHQYLQCLKEGVKRHALSGKPTEDVVTKEEADKAYEQCSLLFKRIAANNAARRASRSKKDEGKSRTVVVKKKKALNR